MLYREGSFALNFARGLLIILFWMSLLAAIGLAAASQLSFPTAAFLAGALMIVVFASGTISSVVEEGSVMGRNHETGKPEHRVVDAVLLPVFKGLLRVVNLTESFSPIESLSTGRSITWGEVSQAFGQIVLLMGGIFGVVGVMLFNRRELAAAQGTS